MIIKVIATNKMQSSFLDRFFFSSGDIRCSKVGQEKHMHQKVAGTIGILTRQAKHARWVEITKVKCEVGVNIFKMK